MYSTEAAPPIGRALRDVVHSASRLVKTEVRLAQAEATEAAAILKSLSQEMLISAVLVALGAVPFMAFFVLGLGELLDGRYWLSSLIVALLFSGGGLWIYLRSRKELRERMALPLTKRSLESAADSLHEKVNQMKQTVGGTER